MSYLAVLGARRGWGSGLVRPWSRRVQSQLCGPACCQSFRGGVNWLGQRQRQRFTPPLPPFQSLGRGIAPSALQARRGACCINMTDMGSCCAPLVLFGYCYVHCVSAAQLTPTWDATAESVNLLLCTLIPETVNFEAVRVRVIAATIRPG